MDHYFELNGVSFVANKKKMIENSKKHAITFESAAQAFFDPFLMNLDASRNFEQREAVLGYDNDSRLLFVVYLECEDEKIRIISARLATRVERLHYENY